ncbi:Putative binding domain-containing protein, N-terminal [Pseudarcicella hirudinis]|uniref:Putative binding domain-containing protein, N-terminal n=1 Tax=Pseudarcicella hirudinis TaxID=1079859 RepID=A0A1I5YSN4_9BACT|nr:BACON domain-containing carbohydrate-binding protein [Pseudarcicella hirudinis]SFQ47162.1 Putative binding domain-containing protein, N-terminal [Pseudarcicella hirudinis]
MRKLYFVLGLVLVLFSLKTNAQICTTAPSTSTSGNDTEGYTYSFNITQAGSYTFKITYASGESNPTGKIIVDSDAAIQFTLSNTASWTPSVEATISGVTKTLSVGTHSVRITGATGVSASAFSHNKLCAVSSGTSSSLSVSPGTISPPASGAGSYTITVSSNVTWTVSTNSNTWFSVSTTSGSNNGSFNITVQDNTSATSRSGTVTVTGGSGAGSQNITVSQAGASGGGGTGTVNGANLGEYVGVNASNTGQSLAGISSFNLAVNGKVLANEVRVRTGWADFVFDKNYTLKNLSQVEQYIKVHKHLPEIPSASEVDEKGISVGEMNAKLLQKIEELTLYIIQQEKDIKALEKKYRNSKQK